MAGSGALVVRPVPVGFQVLSVRISAIKDVINSVIKDGVSG